MAAVHPGEMIEQSANRGLDLNDPQQPEEVFRPKKNIVKLNDWLIPRNYRW